MAELKITRENFENEVMKSGIVNNSAVPKYLNFILCSGF